MKPEEWRSVVGWESVYEVSDLGRVRSLDRTDTLGRSHTGVVRAPQLWGSYLSVNLSGRGKLETRAIHELVCTAFHGPCPTGMECRHLNGVWDDNRADNLTWGTQTENMRDKSNHGRHHNGNKTHCPQGHAYTEENTYWHPPRAGAWRASRDCVTCKRDERKRRTAAKKEASGVPS